jgi:hypothetical protein
VLDRVVCSRFLGIGVEWSAYPWWNLSDERWQRVLRRVEFMRLPLTRVMESAFYYWNGFDGNGTPSYSFESSFQSKLHRLLDWCEQHNTAVIIGEWGAPVSVDGLSLANDDLRWPLMIADHLQYLQDVKHYSCIKYYNLINEPHGSWSTAAGRFPEWKRAMMNLASELRSRQLHRRLQLLAPDADSEWTDRTLADPELRALTGLYDEHWYVTREEVARGEVEVRCRDRVEQIAQYDTGKRFILGELGIVDGKTEDDKQPNVHQFWYGLAMADAAVQLLRGGCAAFIAWCLDDAMHFFGDDKVILRDGDAVPADSYARRKVWGMWNSLGGLHGHPEDEQLRPWFYTWSLLSRCFPPGCDVVEATVDPPDGLRLAATRLDVDGQQHLSFALVSQTEDQRLVHLRATGLRTPINIDVYEYFDLNGDNRVDAWPNPTTADGRDQFPRPVRRIRGADLGHGIELVVPGAGVIFATTLRCDESWPRSSEL